MATFPIRSTDHVDRGVRRILCQFRNATKFRGIVAVYLDRLQGLEDTIWDLIDHVSIDAAEGALLRAIGKIAGAYPGNLTDALFRVRIRVRIRINRSESKIEDLLDVFSLATTGIDDAAPILTEFDPATILFFAYGSIDPAVSDVIFEALREAKACGVRLFYVGPGGTGGDADDAALFGDSSDAYDATDLNHGTAYDGSSAYGGILSGVYAS